VGTLGYADQITFPDDIFFPVYEISGFSRYDICDVDERYVIRIDLPTRSTFSVNVVVQIGNHVIKIHFHKLRLPFFGKFFRKNTVAVTDVGFF